jgi:hypothetical protein
VFQVLSDTVAKAFAFYGDLRTVETERFVKNLDTFFDYLNVRHPLEHLKCLKPNLEPYTIRDSLYAGFSPEEIVRVALPIPHQRNICIIVVIFSFFQPHQREFGPLRVTFGLLRVVFHLPITALVAGNTAFSLQL